MTFFCVVGVQMERFFVSWELSSQWQHRSNVVGCHTRRCHANSLFEAAQARYKKRKLLAARNFQTFHSKAAGALIAGKSTIEVPAFYCVDGSSD